MSSDNLSKALRGSPHLLQNGVLQVVLEHVLVVVLGLAVP